jgi:hypothetical protein
VASTTSLSSLVAVQHTGLAQHAASPSVPRAEASGNPMASEWAFFVDDPMASEWAFFVDDPMASEWAFFDDPRAAEGAFFILI